MTRRLATALVAVVVVAAVACGGDDRAGDRSADAGSLTSSPPSTGSSATTLRTFAPTTTITTTTTATPPPPMPMPMPTERQEVVRADRGRPEVALTFDCGSGAGPTPTILEVLRTAGVRATFFLTGRWVESEPDLTRTIASEHDLGNHTWSHPELTEVGDAEIVDQLERAEAIVVAVTGRSTRPLWRAPFGARDARVLRVAAEAGWPVHVYWAVDPLDWRETTPAEDVRARVASRLADGIVVLQHCASQQTADVLAGELADIVASGRRVVTVAQLLAP